MPVLTVPLHKLWQYRNKIPVRKADCYLVDAVRDGESLLAYDGAVALRRAADFNPFPRDELEVDWKSTYVRGTGRSIPLGMGESVDASTDESPIFCTFRWGEGHPKVRGVEMLPHKARIYKGSVSDYCRYCRAHVGNPPTDCPSQRLKALAAAKTESEQALHRKAVKIWHKG